MVNCDHYSYRVIWSPEDQEFAGLCTEFPSLSYLDADRHAAFEGIISLVKDVVADMEANGEQVPEPIVEKTYSGRFIVRTTPDRHRKLVIEAAERDVSLNRYVNDLLTC
jgi:predicted HicB family RNase H-like nuclease